MRRGNGAARGTRRVAAALALLVGVTACGGDDGAAEASDAVDVSEDVVLSRDVPVAGDETAAADAADDAADGVLDAGPPYAREFTVVEVDSAAPVTLQLAVQACVGLHNRRLGGSVYVRQEAHDDLWLNELELAPSAVVDAGDFLDACVAEFPACVRYAYGDQQELLPPILTVAAALGAVPLDVGLNVPCEEVVFDATVEFAGRNTPYLATKFVFDNYVEHTTGLAMLNPGYDPHASDLANPEMTGDMRPAMVDFVFSQKLFVVFLVNGCVPPTPERALLHEIVNESGWPTPLGVYGYNDSWNVGGYLYEAQTRCLDSRNMGAIPTETGNLSFFSTRRPPIVDPGELEPNAPEDVEYDPSRTYVAFVIGDGDNVRFIMTARHAWLRQRLEDCAQADRACAPITWSISPHLARIAPDVLEWYYAASRRTGRDWFVLPPSGHLYAYPTSLNEEDQERFVAATEWDARILGVGGTVHWDWFETWPTAEARFLPRYARADGAIRGVFPVNVPYMLPTFPWWSPDEFFRALPGDDGSEVAVFRPREWRGVDDSGTGSEEPFFLSPQRMADELGGYPPGTITAVYMTSDGGLNLENSFVTLVGLLPPHVQLVSADTAARLALAAGRD